MLEKEKGLWSFIKIC